MSFIHPSNSVDLPRPFHVSTPHQKPLRFGSDIRSHMPGLPVIPMNPELRRNLTSLAFVLALLSTARAIYKGYQTNCQFDNACTVLPASPQEREAMEKASWASALIAQLSLLVNRKLEDDSRVTDMETLEQAIRDSKADNAE